MNSPESGARLRPLLRRADQVTVAVIVAGSTILLLAHLLHWQVRQGQLIEIQNAPHRPSAFLVDVNTADWPELTLLPGVGETLARRIVQYRHRQGSFSTVEELQNVRGIGPATLQRIRPYLSFSDP